METITIPVQEVRVGDVVRPWGPILRVRRVNDVSIEVECARKVLGFSYQATVSRAV